MTKVGRLGGLLALCAATLGGSGCALGYVTRAAYEEARVLWRRQPIERMLAEPGIGADDKRKLQLVLAVREFAAERLGLSVGGSFRAVSRVDGDAIVQLLTAARRDRLEAVTWWFPIVGRIPYKGFFSKSDVVAAAADLERRGYDSYVRPAIAFSTLGWFDDPLPSSLLRRSEVTLAEVIFHELFHNTLFLPGEITFDESAATFTGYRAAIELFCDAERALPTECREASEDWQDTLSISSFLSASLSRLERFYATAPQGPILEEGRQREFEEIRRNFKALKLHPGNYADFAAGPINNASLLELRVYLRDLDVFEELYRNHGGLRPALEALQTAVGEGGDPFEQLKRAVGKNGLSAIAYR